jgi:uncharacterized protein (TIGR02147 family)
VILVVAGVAFLGNDFCTRTDAAAASIGYPLDMHLFEHTDYRAWLKERAEEIKGDKPFFSYRFLAARLGINAGLVARIFNAQAHVSLKHLEELARAYGLEGTEKEYFGELVRFGRAKSSADWDWHFNRMQAIRGEASRTVTDEQIAYYSAWQHNALRTLLSIHAFKGTNYKRLGSRMVPPLDAMQVKESLELLESLGLIRKGMDGFWEVPDRFLSTGEKWQASMITRFQKEMVRLSAESLDTVPKELRDISTLTLPFSRTFLETARERIRAFRQEMLALARECPVEDCVVQLNIQLFPLALLDPQGPGVSS